MKHIAIFSEEDKCKCYERAFVHCGRSPYFGNEEEKS
jgi:hypothetical protein